MMAFEKILAPMFVAAFLSVMASTTFALENIHVGHSTKVVKAVSSCPKAVNANRKLRHFLVRHQK
jgi:hypothetical protein